MDAAEHIARTIEARMPDRSSRLVLTPKAAGHISHRLQRLCVSAQLESAILIDRLNGVVLGQHGLGAEADTTGLGALTAATFASASETALLLGNHALRDVMIRGENSEGYTCLVGETALLFASYANDIQQGLVKLMARSAASDLAYVLLEAQATRVETPRRRAANPHSAVEDTVDLLFKD